SHLQHKRTAGISLLKFSELTLVLSYFFRSSRNSEIDRHLCCIEDWNNFNIFEFYKSTGSACLPLIALEALQRLGVNDFLPIDATKLFYFLNKISSGYCYSSPGQV